jgi:hypothetical protein
MRIKLSGAGYPTALSLVLDLPNPAFQNQAEKKEGTVGWGIWQVALL